MILFHKGSYIGFGAWDFSLFAEFLLEFDKSLGQELFSQEGLAIFNKLISMPFQKQMIDFHEFIGVEFGQIQLGCEPNVVGRNMRE